MRSADIACGLRTAVCQKGHTATDRVCVAPIMIRHLSFAVANLVGRGQREICREMEKWRHADPFKRRLIAEGPGLAGTR